LAERKRVARRSRAGSRASQSTPSRAGRAALAQEEHPDRNPEGQSVKRHDTPFERDGEQPFRAFANLSSHRGRNRPRPHPAHPVGQIRHHRRAHKDDECNLPPRRSVRRQPDAQCATPIPQSAIAPIKVPASHRNFARPIPLAYSAAVNAEVETVPARSVGAPPEAASAPRPRLIAPVARSTAPAGPTPGGSPPWLGPASTPCPML